MDANTHNNEITAACNPVDFKTNAQDPCRPTGIPFGHQASNVEPRARRDGAATEGSERDAYTQYTIKEITESITDSLAANSLGISGENISRLAEYAQFLLEWNEKINLVSRASAGDFATQHIADSALAETKLPAKIRTLVDLGSGGGLPGIVIAILRPDVQVTLAETKEKKIRFLRECVRALNLQNIRVYDAARLSPVANDTAATNKPTVADKHDILVCRAFASLPMIVRESKKYLRPGGEIYAFKGRLETAKSEQKKLRCTFKPYRLHSPCGKSYERTLVIIR